MQYTLLVEMPYSEFAPPASLAAHVDRLWLRTTVPASAGDAGRVVRILPDGCIDVIVRADRGTAEVVGAMTRAIEVPGSVPAELVAVRFRPGTGAALVGLPLGEITDQHVAAEDLGLAVSALVDQIGAATTPAARIAALATWVEDRLVRQRRRHPAPPDPLVALAVARLTMRHPPPVDVLARELGITRQHLARLFQREVGVTPKLLLRTARLQRAAHAIARGRTDFAALAAELGYFDQAHLVHDVRALAGVTPGALARDPAVTSPHLFDAAAPIPFLQSRRPRTS